ncbi:MAG TPA: DUF1592 domain-containing protein [Pirellulales bacterium]
MSSYALRVSCSFLIGMSIAMLGQRVTAGAAEADWDALAGDYRQQVQPLVARFCHDCHCADLAEADVDLTQFSALAEVRKQPRVWQKVDRMLDSGQMPPPDADQPNRQQRAKLQAWVRSYLTAEAAARAGDPGRVVLRRLNNAEYTYTLRDLTGVASLDPAREFPADGAAGEGFTNTGNALAMSPALVTKYLDAAKEVAEHAVLLPDGMRFSPHATRRDWTDETLAEIREFYRRFTDTRGSDTVNLQGIVFNTNEGGRLPVERYLAATLAEREALAAGRKTSEAVAHERGLNAKYLGMLWANLTGDEPSLLLDRLRLRWRAAKESDAGALANEVAAWQKSLWTFRTVGHIGKVGGPKAWLEPVTPLAARQDVRFKIAVPPGAKNVTLSLVAGDAGDGNEQDTVVWQSPRLVRPGRPDLLLRDVRLFLREADSLRRRVFAKTGDYLAAAQQADAALGNADPTALAAQHGLEVEALRAWLDYLGIGAGGAVQLSGHFTKTLENVSGHDFIQGWGASETPLLVANSSDEHVRIPGNMKPHSVAVHPSPAIRAAIGWRSPVSAPLRIEAAVTHAHPECGNGVAWTLEVRRGATRRRLATGVAQGAKPVAVGPIEHFEVHAGDVVALLVGPRDRNHSCDLTAVDLKLTAEGEGGKTWSLADDVSPKVLSGNPHDDRFGNAAVWHFFTEADNQAGPADYVIPAGSVLADWQTAPGDVSKQELAARLQALLTEGPNGDTRPADAELYQQLASLGGPLLGRLVPGGAPQDSAAASSAEDGEWGLDPAAFGKHVDGAASDAASLCVQAPSIVTFSLPADLAAGAELVTTGALDARTGCEGSVQLQAVAGAPHNNELTPSTVAVSAAGGQWTDGKQNVSFGVPIVVNQDSAARARWEKAFDDFRQWFPAALCYTKIVPVDEVVTLTLFYREDHHLARLMLDEPQQARLDRLWDELHYVSQDALTLVDGYAQLLEFATQDADPKVFEPLRESIYRRAVEFRQLLIDSEPRHLDALLEFAARASRRPLTEAERQKLLGLYRQLRAEDLPHDKAVRLLLARVLVSPAFLYRAERPGPGTAQAPVNDWELASRLSYFLWSSLPDDELRQTAAAGELTHTDVLVRQTHRMLHDPRVRRLATEFACQWLHIHDFENLDEKSDRHFPTFAGLRGAMYEESIQFFIDLFQSDRSVLDILDADYTFLNQTLAEHYGIPGVSGPQWRRVEGVKRFDRGGILAQATTLAKQSGASRTSPILRGNWISEVLLGERLPRPPKDTPQLPDDEAALEGLTVRQLVEKHSSDPKCVVCHQRIDAMGFALETFDAIGRRRDKDLGDRPINTRVKTMDGQEFDGLDGLRQYLLGVRREAFVRQFCRKLLGYSLGREIQLSDEPLLGEMQTVLKANDYRVLSALELVVRSRQFREIRGRETADEDG